MNSNTIPAVEEETNIPREKKLIIKIYCFLFIPFEFTSTSTIADNIKLA